MKLTPVRLLLIIGIAILVFGSYFIYMFGWETDFPKSKANTIMQYEPVPQKTIQEEIITIEKWKAGGRMGSALSLLINKDSVVKQRKSGFNGDSSSKVLLIKPEEWKKLINSFTLKDFQQIKNGRSKQPIDGIDIGYTIHTSAKTYYLINGSADTINFPKINRLITYIERYESRIPD